MRIIKKISILLFFLACVPFAAAVQIQLDAVQNADNKAGMNVGYVEVNVLFEEHPMTARLKEEFLKEAEKRRQIDKEEYIKLKALENVFVSTTTEIRELRLDIENIKKNQNQPQILPQNPSVQVSTTNPKSVQPTTISAPAVTTAPETQIKAKEELIAGKEKALEAVKIDIEKKKLEILRLKKKHKEELEKLENKEDELVMADLDQVIGEVAKDENLTVILDKSNVLYGNSVKDVTDKVRQRLRGR